MILKRLTITIIAGLGIVSCDQSQTTPLPQAASASQSSLPGSAPQAWDAWARWADEQHSTGDDQGHGPDIGSDEWAYALDQQLGISDGQGHGPDLKSAEWRSAVEYKLQNR